MQRRDRSFDWSRRLFDEADLARQILTDYVPRTCT